MKPDEIRSMFAEIVEKTEKPFIILCVQPDPDAMGSALGGKLVLENYFNKEASIYYCQEISDLNIHAVNQFDLGSIMRPISEFLEQYNAQEQKEFNYVLVDSFSNTDTRIPEKFRGAFDPLIVIDHHTTEGLLKKKKGHFFWIATDAGSASTLIVELIHALNLQLTGDDLSTAAMLAYGIYNDTKSLLEAKERDTNAFMYLREHLDKNKKDIVSLINHPPPRSFLKNSLRALANKRDENSTIVTGIGIVQPEEGDYISIIADNLLVQDISIVFVWAIIKYEQRYDFRGACRTCGTGKNPDKLIKEWFGTGGGRMSGKHGASGVQFPLGIDYRLFTRRTQDQFISGIRTWVEDIIFGIEEEQE